MNEDIFNLKIFAWIDRNIVTQIISLLPSKIFKNGEIIFVKDAESNWEWYIIKSWKVKVTIAWVQIAELSSWDIVWEIALLNEDIRTATVEATEDVEVIVLNLESLIEIINHDDNFINKSIVERMEQNLERENN